MNFRKAYLTRRARLLLALTLAGPALVAGCSSESDEARDPADNSRGSAGSGGSAGSIRKPPAREADCETVRRGEVCTLEGQRCESLVCGLADTGTRDCECSEGVWTCTCCESPYITEVPWPSGPVPHCPVDAAEGNPCTNPDTLCFASGVPELCACFEGDDGLAWVCGVEPPTPEC